MLVTIPRNEQRKPKNNDKTMTPFTIYLWQQADSIRSILNPFCIAGCISAVAFVITTIVFLIEGGDEVIAARCRDVRKWALAGIAAGIASYSLTCLMPSSKTIALMVAIPAVANSEPIQKDLPELYKLAVEALKDQIASKPEK